MISTPLNRQRGPYFHGLLAQPNCERCPLQNDTKVYPDGPGPARIAFVGEGPGLQEVSEGRGFVGASGQLLWQMAEEIGLKREDVWTTNAALCRPRSVKFPNGATLPVVRVKVLSAIACRQRLIQELIAVDPVVIVPLGNFALWALSDMENARIYAYRGSRIEVDLKTLSDRIARGTAHNPAARLQAGKY